MPRRSASFRLSIGVVLGWVVLGWLAGPVAAADPQAPDDALVAALIADLGSQDFAVREQATTRLAELGTEAIDAVLTAAEVSEDLEIALRARWLAESLPLAARHDPPEVVALLERFSRADYAERIRIMHRLVRLDHDAGIEPLARIVRLERTATGSRIAAALLVQEWGPNEPYWPAMVPRITAGLLATPRPAARFLRALCEWSVASGDAAAKPLAEAKEAAAQLAAAAGETAAPAGDLGDASVGIAWSGPIFRRCLVAMLAASQERDAALAVARDLLAEVREADAEGRETALELERIAAAGLPEVVDEPAARQDESPFVRYAQAMIRLRRGEAGAAARLADAAQRSLADAADGIDRMRAAIMLTSWGGAEWAEREYRGVIDDPAAAENERMLAAILCSELLHDLERHADAADLLRTVLEPPGRRRDEVEQTIQLLGRDPRAVRGRMLYFAARGTADPAARRGLLEDSLRANPREVDSLIALYGLPDATADQRAEAAARVARCLESIHEELVAEPAEPNHANEYAWLVANTEGDIGKAIRQSRRSLELSFDSASYLDTLAHCHAAAGDLDLAVRTQWLAHRQEPHNRTIGRNLDRFRAQASGRKP